MKSSWVRRIGIKKIERLAFLLLLTGCNIQPQADLAAVGDSVTWGYGDLPGGWVRHLEQDSGYSVANLAVPGEYSEAAADRIDSALRLAPAAKVVFLLHGGNNWIRAWKSDGCKQSCEPDAVENEYLQVGEHLRRMRSAIARRGKQTVFLDYWPDVNAKCPNYADAQFKIYQDHRLRLNQELANVAAENGDLLIHLDDMAAIAVPSNFYDCLHPSAEGYHMIADRIMQELASWAPADASPSDITNFRPRL